MKAFTEMQDHIRRLASINPEKDIAVIDTSKGIEIYSIGDEGALYLTYENNGNISRFSRVKILDKTNEFAVSKIAGNEKIAVAAADDKDVILAITDNPPGLTKNSFKRINLDGMLGGKKLTPSNLLIAALEQGITLFIEMEDAGGRIEQFACVIDSSNPEDVEYFPLASNYSSVTCSVAGRAVKQYVDGIYTCGEYGGTKQLLYTPSRNIFGETQPAPIRLKNAFNVETICALPLSRKAGTHLFAVGDKGLYFYPYERQLDMYHTENPDPDFAVSSDFFEEAKKVSAVVFDDKVYVYVLNESNILSYTYADYINDAPSKFKEPVRLMENVYYFDLSGGGTMNICTADKAVFGKRNPDTGNWGFTEAHIETNLDEYKKMTAYVTKIMTDAPDDDTLRITVKGNKKMSCYVNGTYHNFLRLYVKTDSMGVISVVQEAVDLNPDCFEVEFGSEKIYINPAEEMRKRVLSLTDTDKLKSEMINYSDGRQSGLFKDTDDMSRNIFVAGISSLNGATNSILPGFIKPPINEFTNGIIVKITDKVVSILPYEVTHNPFISFMSDVIHDIEYAFNWVIDKVKWLYDHTIAPVVDFVMAKINSVWKFVVKIGEKVLEVVVDTIEAVFATVKKLLEFIGIPIDEILDWLKKALGLDHVEKTNNIMKKMIKLSCKKLTDQSAAMKGDIIKTLDMMIDSVRDWAYLDTLKAKNASNTIVKKKISDTGFGITPQNSYMFDTILGGLNFDAVTLPVFKPTPALSKALDALNEAIGESADQFGESTDAVLSIGNNVEEIFGSGDIYVIFDQLKQILGKVAVVGLEVCKSFVGLIFDIVTITLEVIMELFMEPIHIPFVSEVLKIFGIKKFCLIDLITFPVAFFVTTVTLIAISEPPFPEGIYNNIMKAKSLDEINGMRPITIEPVHNVDRLWTRTVGPRLS
jgi:hypothetical protein